jgi:23S rRNA (uridine2552-2'-O)-methyltransferase
MAVRARNKKINKVWLNDHLNDPYVKLAQKEGYRARAAYKLKEIDEVFKLVKPGQCIVDLGAAPGAWSQYLRRKLGPGEGTLIALDVLDMEPVDGVKVVQGDFREQDVLDALVVALEGKPVDLVLSDLAPNLSGIESADAARMSDLLELALEFAKSHLKPGGDMVVKVFHGSGHSQTVAAFKQRFRLVKPHKPKASRDRSSETFLVGLGHKP